MRDDDDLTAEPPETDDAPPRFGSGRIRHLSIDVLSLHVDRALDPDGHQLAETHLAACPDCLKDFGELRLTVLLLSGLPQYQPRRTFLLTPEYGAAKTRPLPAGPSAGPAAPAASGGGWSGRLLPGARGLRIATAIAGVAFLATVAGDLAVPDPAAQRAAVAVPSAATSAIGIRATMATVGPRSAEAAPAPAPGEPQALAADAPAPGAARPAAPALPSPWRIAQLATGMLLLWLLVSLAGRGWLDRHERLPG